MAAVQGGNLNDVYGQMFGQIAGGLLARADFPADQYTIQQFLDTVAPIALAATRRVAVTVGDMSTVTPPESTYDSGYSLGSPLYLSAQAAVPPPPYVPPTTVMTPLGDRVEYKPPKT